MIDLNAPPTESPLDYILAGGGIGYLVDRNTGAGFNYPDSITVVLRKIGEAVGLATPAVPPEVQTTSK